MVSVSEKRAFRGCFYHHLPVLKVEKLGGKQGISIVYMSFSKCFYFYIVLVALHLSSNSESAQTGGGGC